MVAELLASLPQWAYLGIAIGALLSVGVAATFLVATRRYPDGNRTIGSQWSTEQRRRAEMRGYLDAISEPYVEGGTVAERTVAFYLPDREVAVTFDAQTFYALESSGVQPILVEHEMPGVHLGSRLPFETPSVDFGSDDRTDEPAEAAFAVLGLPPDADRETVRRAYRRRLKEVHPDQGGSRAEFHELQEAYDTATQHA